MVGRNLAMSPCANKHDLHMPSSAELDLRDYNQTVSYFEAKEPDLVIHAAGRVGVSRQILLSLCASS